MQEDKEIIGELLRSHGLKRTPIRIEILEVFMNHDVALSAMVLLEKLPKERDRVTIYRALSSFEDSGIIHRASEDQTGIKYALCSEHCSTESHQDRHAHFLCEECNETYCLQNVKIPDVAVNDGFKVSGMNFVLNGVCRNCRSIA